MEQSLMLESKPEVSLDDLNRLNNPESVTGFKTYLDLLSSLFNAPLEPEGIKSITMILGRKKRLVKLKFKKRKSVYPIGKKKGFVLLYKLNPSDSEEETKEIPELIAQSLGMIPERFIPDELPINIIRTPDALLIYTEILYNEEPRVETVMYEERFDPLNRYQELYESGNTRVLNDYIDNKTIELTDYKPDLDSIDTVRENVSTILEQPKVLVIEYEQPWKTSTLDIYEEIFLRNRGPPVTVKDILPLTGLGYEIIHTEEFGGSDYLTLLDNKRDGEKKRYWEVLINGRYAKNSIDKQLVGEEDLVTFRLAENKAGCGGSYREELMNFTMLMTQKGKPYPVGSEFNRMPWYIV